MRGCTSGTLPGCASCTASKPCSVDPWVDLSCSMAPTRLIQADGSLTPIACDVLHAVSAVPMDQLRSARIRRSRDNWLHAPWYPYHRGGAITIGRSIWCTRLYFDVHGYGDGSIDSTWRWLLLLAHEVGHLPQAERFGFHAMGKAEYVTAFVWQYASRAITLRFPVHDGSALEIEADMGRWVLRHAIGDAPLAHPLVIALHANDAEEVRGWCEANGHRLRALREEHPCSIRVLHSGP